MKLAKNYAFLRRDLKQIESTLEDTIFTDQPVLHEASTQLLRLVEKDFALFLFYWQQCLGTITLVK